MYGGESSSKLRVCLLDEIKLNKKFIYQASVYRFDERRGDLGLLLAEEILLVSELLRTAILLFLSPTSDRLIDRALGLTTSSLNLNLSGLGNTPSDLNPQYAMLVFSRVIIKGEQNNKRDVTELKELLRGG